MSLEELRGSPLLLHWRQQEMMMMMIMMIWRSKTRLSRCWKYDSGQHKHLATFVVLYHENCNESKQAGDDMCCFINISVYIGIRGRLNRNKQYNTNFQLDNTYLNITSSTAIYSPGCKVLCIYRTWNFHYRIYKRSPTDPISSG
jgi:hypothetical protein